MHPNAADEIPSNEETDTVAESVNEPCENNTPDISGDANAPTIADGDGKLLPDETPVQVGRAAMPIRRVGQVRSGSTPQPVSHMTNVPPRRRAASVFGTWGSEIVTYPAQVSMSDSVDAVAVQAVSGGGKPETNVRDETDLEVQETEREETDASGCEQPINDDANAEKVAGRRVYVRFNALRAESGTAYIHVLLNLFADYPGEDTVALVFEDTQPFSEDCDAENGTITAPDGVDYDEISEAVQNIVGEDAVVEIME